MKKDIVRDQQLDAEEQDLLNSVKRGEWKSVKNIRKEKSLVYASARNHFKKIRNQPDLLAKDISILIDESRSHVAREYNSTQVLLCWLIGKRIDDEILKSGRAEYGETIIVSLATHLTLVYGKGYSRPNLFRMIKFAKLFPTREIVSTLSRQLSWSHFVLICGIENELQRDFYAEMCRVQHWSVRTLKKQLDGMLYERTAISKQPEKIIKSQLGNLKSTDERANGVKSLFVTFDTSINPNCHK